MGSGTARSIVSGYEHPESMRYSREPSSDSISAEAQHFQYVVAE
jgi:hypothetical protein